MTGGMALARPLAASLAMLVSVWAPAQAWAWIPGQVPTADAPANTSWLSSDQPVASQPLQGLDRQLGSELELFAMEPTRHPQTPWTTGVGMGNFDSTTSGFQMFGFNWMYWAGAIAAGGVALAALDGGSSGGGNGADGGGDHETPSAPAPEPSSLLIFGLGGLLCVFAGRRKLFGSSSAQN